MRTGKVDAMTVHVSTGVIQHRCTTSGACTDHLSFTPPNEMSNFHSQRMTRFATWFRHFEDRQDSCHTRRARPQSQIKLLQASAKPCCQVDFFFVPNSIGSGNNFAQSEVTGNWEKGLLCVSAAELDGWLRSSVIDWKKSDTCCNLT